MVASPGFKKHNNKPRAVALGRGGKMYASGCVGYEKKKLNYENR